MLKKVLAAIAAVAMVFAMTGTAQAYPKSQRLLFFFGDKGTVRWQNGKDDQGQLVDDSPLDSNHSRLSLNVPSQSTSPPYSYAGVYANNTGLGGQPIGSVRNLSFDYLDPSGGGYAGAGAPRFSVPIDANGNGVMDTGEGYAFMAGSECSTPIPSSDWDRADFTGQTALGCTIYGPDGNAYSSDGTNSAWANFVAGYGATNPLAKVAPQSQAVAFVIQDEVGNSFIDRVAFQNRMYVKYGHGNAAIKICPTEASC